MPKGVKLGKRTASKLIEMANRRKGYSLPGTESRFREGSPSETISVHNASGEDVPEYGILELDGTVLNEADLELPPDAKSAIYTGVKPVNLPNPASGTIAQIWNKRVVIAQQAIKAGEVGQCLYSGISAVKVYSEHNPNPYEAHVSTTQSLNRLDAQFHGSGYGFPILWRERGTGEKWALVRLGHEDLPGFYYITNPVGRTSVFRPPIWRSEKTWQPGWSAIDGGLDLEMWRYGPRGGTEGLVHYNTAVPFIDDANGLRIQGHTTWLGSYSGSLTIHTGASVNANGEPYLKWVYPGEPTGQVSIAVKGHGINYDSLSASSTWQVPQRSLHGIKIPDYTSIGTTLPRPSGVQDIFHFNINFIFSPYLHDMPATVTQPIKIRLIIGQWSWGSALVESNPNFSYLREVVMLHNRLIMHEVNPRKTLGGTLSSPGGISGGGNTNTHGTIIDPTFSPKPYGTDSIQASIFVNANPTKTLQSSFGNGISITPPVDV